MKTESIAKEQDMRERWLYFIASGVVSCCAFACGQETPHLQPATQSQLPVIQSNTSAVAVDVVVTRGKDEPVGGLHKEDFVLSEDGKPQAIDFFEEHVAPAALAEIAPLPAMPPHVFTNVPAAPVADSVNVLLLDVLNTPRPDQSYVREEILKFLGTMKPDARIAIFILGTKLSLLQGFTDDPALLRAAIADKKTGLYPQTTDVSRSRKEDDEDKEMIAMRQANLGGRGRTTAGIATLTRTLAELKNMEEDQRVTLTLDALQKLGRYLAGIPGRKNLIWFASQYPIYLFPDTGERQPHVYMRAHDEEIKKTVQVLTLSKVAVYPIDAEGMMNDHAMDSEHDLGAAGMGASMLQNTMRGAQERSVKMSAMEQIAIDTGGQAIFNNNDLNASLNRVIHLGEHYYTLVYTPTNKKRNGDFRRIEVNVKTGKYKLAYRRGYYAVDTAGKQTVDGAQKPGAEVVDPRIQRLRAMLGRGMASATEVLYGVRVLPAATQPAANAKPAGANAKLTGPVTRYAVDFLLDPKKIALPLVDGGAHQGWIRVELVAYSDDGKALNWNGETLRTRLDAAGYASVEKVGIPVHMEIDVPAGAASIATGVYDLEGDKAGTLEAPLNEPSRAVASKQ